MSEELIVKHCSPTLAGLKTGNAFSCDFESVHEMRATIRSLNKRLCKKGLRVLPLRYYEGRALIYVYRPALLSADLCNSEAKSLLSSRGYNCENADVCVRRLVGRCSECGEFPHEIGLFLGYPPEDVEGFIENKAGGCKYVGCWKVYGDVDSAKRTFAQYKKCTDVYCKCWRSGKPIERLTVVV